MSFPYAIALSYDAAKATFIAKGTTPLGTVGVDPEGNAYHYCLAGAVDLVAGTFTTLITTPVNEQTVTVAHAVGTRTVTLTSGSTTLNQFQNGHIVVTAGADNGSIYRIRSNSVDVANIATFVLQNESGLNAAWSTTTTDVDIFENPFNDQVVCPVDGQQLAVAVSQTAVTLANYYWGLYEGYGTVQIDSNAQAAGLELDEKVLNQSLNHAGQAFVDGTPDATALLVGYRQILGYLLTEADVVDNEWEYARIRL